MHAVLTIHLFLYKMYRRKNNKTRKQNKKRSLSNIHVTIKHFQDTCKEMQVFSCVVCSRYLFKKQVCKLNLKKYSSEVVKLCFSSLSSEIYVKREISLKAGNIPPQAMANNLCPFPSPASLKDLNQLGKHLISPIIPFMKIMALPKGLQKGIHGPIICVPSNISKGTTSLPRPLK